MRTADEIVFSRGEIKFITKILMQTIFVWKKKKKKTIEPKCIFKKK